MHHKSVYADIIVNWITIPFMQAFDGSNDFSGIIFEDVELSFILEAEPVDIRWPL